MENSWFSDLKSPAHVCFEGTCSSWTWCLAILPSFRSTSASFLKVTPKMMANIQCRFSSVEERFFLLNGWKRMAGLTFLGLEWDKCTCVNHCCGQRELGWWPGFWVTQILLKHEVGNVVSSTKPHHRGGGLSRRPKQQMPISNCWLILERGLQCTV